MRENELWTPPNIFKNKKEKVLHLSYKKNKNCVQNYLDPLKKNLTTCLYTCIPVF